jgi:hypothetical protein
MKPDVGIPMQNLMTINDCTDGGGMVASVDIGKSVKRKEDTPPDFIVLV